MSASLMKVGEGRICVSSSPRFRKRLLIADAAAALADANPDVNLFDSRFHGFFLLSCLHILLPLWLENSSEFSFNFIDQSGNKTARAWGLLFNERI